jgi:carotenoid cleavage dioxygenase-like enzyme
MTAHPKVDPTTGALVFFGSDVFGPPFLRYHVADAIGVCWCAPRRSRCRRAGMMHDFGVTASRVVFLDLPVVFDLEPRRRGAVGPLPVDAGRGGPGRGDVP